ncbi:unnamed protein product, partial [Brassica rapa subsp. trilocularis]
MAIVSSVVSGYRSPQTKDEAFYCVLTPVFHLAGIDYTVDLVTYNAADNKVEQALITLKKGFQLLIYGRKGKTKF